MACEVSAKPKDITKRVQQRRAIPTSAVTALQSFLISWPLGAPMPPLPAAAPPITLVAPDALRAVPLLPDLSSSNTACAARWLPR